MIMKKIALCFAALLAMLTGLWCLADNPMPAPLTYFSFRALYMQYSGIVAMGVMSVAMLLALRPKLVEPYLGGLDKMYRLHKWLGITALVTGLMHWWLGQGTKWMTQWGWLIRPARGPRPNPGDLGWVEGWLRSQRGVAESVAEWAFYLALVLLVLALVKHFPYRLFQKTHKWLAASYLVFVYHTIVLTKFDYWGEPIGWLLAALVAGGSVAAVLTLLGRIGKHQKVGGVVESVHHYPALRVVEFGIVVQSGWAGHAAGQFAFVTTDRKEGAHPYTIASAWDPSACRIVFIAKALGDHTRRLHEHLATGMPVTVEGPYGCFDFCDDAIRQIWIAAGIGITPFIARMKALAMVPGSKPIDLFHSTATCDADALGKLNADAVAAGVRLHLIDSRKAGRLSSERIRRAVPEWAAASVWYCGPPDFARALRQGFANQPFHQELFQMR